MSQIPYKRIPCGVYDQFELLAMRRTPVSIRYHDVSGGQLQVDDVIINLKSIEKVEYAILKSRLVIRLDWILQLNDLVIQNQDDCKL